MISLKTLVTSAVAALMSGGVGFASASYLQHRASADRMKEIERQHELELTQIHQEAATRLEDERRRQTGALHEQWYGDPLATQARVTRELLDRMPGKNYAALIADPAVTPEEREALRATVRFWVRVHDLAQDELLDMNRAVQRLGPDAVGWSPYMRALTQDLSQTPVNGAVFYAQAGVQMLAERERRTLARLPRAPARLPPASTP